MSEAVSLTRDLDLKYLRRFKQTRTNPNFFPKTSFLQPKDRFELYKISIAVISTDDAIESKVNKSISQLADEISNFTVLVQNWDGYNAIPVYPEIANKTISFLKKFDPLWLNNISDIFPNPAGTITIEWEKNSDESLILEIGKNNYSYFIKYKNKDPLFYDGLDILSHFEDFAKNLSKLFGKQIAL